MIETYFLRILVEDILSIKDYSLEKIADSINMPPDIMQEISTGTIPEPSLNLSMGILKLHSTVRRHLYDELIKKILNTI
jgi:hypothetical protein